MTRLVFLTLGLLLQVSYTTVAQIEIHDVQYLVRESRSGAGFAFSKRLSADQFRELYAGDIRLGPVAVKVIIRCTSDTPLDSTRVRLRITNDATDKIVYNTIKAVTNASLKDSTISGVYLCDQNGNSIPLTPRGYALGPGEFASLTFPPFEPGGGLSDHHGRMMFESISIEGKDTVSHLASLMQRLFPVGFGGHADRLYVMRSSGAIIPSSFDFVNGGATVSSPHGTNPLLYRNTRHSSIANRDSVRVVNPVIRFDRRNERGSLYEGTTTGDTLTSFPIDLTRASAATVSMTARRVYPHGLAHRRWMHDSLYGPESTSSDDSKLYVGDQLVVDLLSPSPDQLNGIVNTVDSNWILLPRMRASLALRDPNYHDRSEVFTIQVPDSILKSPNAGARNFRFRVILHASAMTTKDDDDPWEVERIAIFTDDECDLSISDVEVPLAYSVIPYRQSAHVPLRIRVANHTQNIHTDVRIRADLYSVLDTTRRTAVERLIDTLGGYHQGLFDLQPVDLSRIAASDNDTIVMRASIIEGGDTVFIDLDQHNNTIYRKMPIRLGRSLAYDNYEAEGHHVVAQEAGFARNFGLRTPATMRDDDSISRYGGSNVPTLVGPGGITMSFTLFRRDTLYGYQFAFDRDQPRQSACSLSLVKVVQKESHAIPDATLVIYPGSGAGRDTIETHALDAPLALDSGTYEVTLTQDTHEDLNLCATIKRAGVWVRASGRGDPVWGSEVIADPSWFVNPAKPTFPFRNENYTTRGRIFVGDRAYRSFTYGDYWGTVDGMMTFRRGTFIPVMRVLLGYRSDSISTSVNDSHEALSTPLVQLTPNPVSSTLTISNMSAGGVIVDLYSMQGELLFTYNVESTFNVNTLTLSSGQYVVVARRMGHSTTQIVTVIH